MTGAQMDPQKWNMPGWRIEQKFAPGVLIGNWSEERDTFHKADNKHNSTHRIDFRNFGSSAPDVVCRRKNELRNHGLPNELMFHHHGKEYTNNMVSWYDEDFNGRWREKNLPKLRKWNSHDLAWAPEKSDHRVTVPPTNFGLLGKMQRGWAADLTNQTRGDYLSTYSVSYQDVPADKRVSMRYATPKMESTTLHPVNRTLKDLNLRSHVMMKCPESLPREMTSKDMTFPCVST